MQLKTDPILTWLPSLILFEDYKGLWDLYINALYKYFHQDFVASRPFYQGRPISVRFHPSHNGKGATFWHLVSEGNQESERIPDLRRCERIRWPRPIIESRDVTSVKAWDTFRPWKGQKQRRVNIALEDFSYIVILAENQRGFDLVTAYAVEKSYKRERLRQECETFLGQKKEGSAV
jgi:hypothetical protein